MLIFIKETASYYSKIQNFSLNIQQIFAVISQWFCLVPSWFSEKETCAMCIIEKISGNEIKTLIECDLVTWINKSFHFHRRNGNFQIRPKFMNTCLLNPSLQNEFPKKIQKWLYLSKHADREKLPDSVLKNCLDELKFMTIQQFLPKQESHSSVEHYSAWFHIVFVQERTLYKESSKEFCTNERTCGC